MTSLISALDVTIKSVRALRLDPRQYAIGHPVALAALIRRCASFLAPCSPRTLREAVMTAVRGTVTQEAVGPEQIDDVLEALVGYGDLLELPAREDTGGTRLLYLAQPGFVRRPSGTILLFGVASDGAEELPSSLSERVEYHLHTRRLVPAEGEDLAAALRTLGLQELPESLWWKKPKAETPEALIARFDAALNAASPPGDAAGLQVLDWARAVNYYRGRWTLPGKLTGRYVARREQRYGAPLWSYVELSEGRLTKLSDISASTWRACDYAWQLQLALDRVRGHPQVFKAVRVGSHHDVHFYSPIPRWAQVRWDMLGVPRKEKGALVTYSLPSDELPPERQVLVKELWMSESEADQGRVAR